MEVTQAIQDMHNSVSLIAGKTTWVRVYFSKTGGTLPLTAQLQATRSGGGTTTLAPAASITVDAADTLKTRRMNWSKSLNFQLPAAVAAASKVTLQVVTPTNPGPGGGSVACPSCTNTTQVTFLNQPPLIVRAIGLNYTFGSPPQSAAASTTDFTLLRSWLGRAYPAASVTYSQTSVAATSAWQFDCNQANAQLAAIRANDVSSGTDARTHYFGLVSNRGGYMRGCAAGIPSTPDPSTTASGPTGPTSGGAVPINVTGDHDGSFGDWYGGHELGHTFGRLHPGFCNGNSHDDLSFPYPNGQIGTDVDNGYAGLDVGDSANSIPLAVLWPTVSFDIMTYCNQPQWLSAYNYEAVRQRLLDENPGFHTMALVATARLAQRTDAMVHVAATVNLTRGTGAFAFVTPVQRSVPQAGATNRAALVVRDESGRELSRTPVALRESTDVPEGEDKTALVDGVVPFNPAMAQIDLVLDGRVLAQYRNATTAPSAPREVRPGGTDIQPHQLVQPGPAQPGRTLTWAPPENPAGTVTYTVQISDDGNTWSTIAVGLTEPRLTLTADQGRAQMARIIAHNGFRNAPPLVIRLR